MSYAKRSSRRWQLAHTSVLGLGIALVVFAGRSDVALGRAQAEPPLAIDTNPDPHVFETAIFAVQARVELGDDLLANAYTYNGSIPGPEFRLEVGDRVIVHFSNFLPEPSSIHWHGVEVNNASDGTPITQNAVEPGGSYTYRFVVDEPGIYWYHPHFKPTNPEFKGQYGSFIVEDPAEKTLRSLGVIPNRGHTKTLVLADTTVCKSAGSNDAATFAADPSLPWAGDGEFPGQRRFPTPDELCENPRDNLGNPLGGGPLAAGEIPNVQAPATCPFRNCATNEGQLVLANGKVPAARAGSPAAPGSLAPRAPVVNVRAGAGLRLQLIGAAVTRYFRLRMTDAMGQQVLLYRIGGEGGLLDHVRLEGGMQDLLDTQYDRGEILLAPAERADVVLVVPDGEVGDIATLWTLDYEHTGRGFSNVPTVPVLHLRIVGNSDEKRRFAISERDPLRAHPRVGDPTRDLRGFEITDHLLDPALLPEPRPGSADETIRLTVSGARPSIDDTVGSFDPEGLDYEAIAHIASSRYARLGDLLELEVKNETRAHHPFHLHGFSFQPIRVLDPTRYPVRMFDYAELIDTFDIPSEHSLVFRVRLNDRPRMDGMSPGGALGRWLFHCHITFHATLGMISELVVLEP